MKKKFLLICMLCCAAFTLSACIAETNTSSNPLSSTLQTESQAESAAIDDSQSPAEESPAEENPAAETATQEQTPTQEAPAQQTPQTTQTPQTPQNNYTPPANNAPTTPEPSYETPAPEPPAIETPSTYNPGGVRGEVFSLTNAERSANGLGHLSYRTDLQAAADQRAQEIIDAFSHTRPDGRECFSVYSDYGVSYSAAGENLAKGQKNASTAVEQWMNSSGHRANILEGRFTGMAGGYAENDGNRCWVQLFIG